MLEFLKTDLCAFELLGQLSDGDYAIIIVGVSTYTGKTRAIKLYLKSLLMNQPYLNKSIRPNVWQVFCGCVFRKRNTPLSIHRHTLLPGRTPRAGTILLGNQPVDKWTEALHHQRIFMRIVSIAPLEKSLHRQANACGNKHCSCQKRGETCSEQCKCDTERCENTKSRKPRDTHPCLKFWS